jgi:mannose-6-phosphate isomerase-like protein (cupin superfamily)
MYAFLSDPAFIKHKKDSNHYIFRNIGLECPSWENILDCLNDTIEKKINLKILDNLGFVLLENTDKLPGTFDFLNYLSSTTKQKVSAHCYISMLSASKTFGRHNDSSDVFFWQVQGKSKWIVEDHIISEYILEKNDMIFVPKGMVHEVIPLGPRAGISFGIDH